MRYKAGDKVILGENLNVGSLTEVVEAFEKYAKKEVTVSGTRKIPNTSIRGYLFKELKDIQTKYILYVEEKDILGFSDPNVEINYSMIEEYKLKSVDSIPMSAFLTNMNLQALENKYDSCVMRESEIGRVCQILLRKTKCNPLLVGRAGVGKTAVVEGLVQTIIEMKRQSLSAYPQLKKVPLTNYIVYSVNTSALIAGTKYRGDFEERLDKLIEFAKKPNIVLFIDEVHSIVGMNENSKEGTVSMSQLIKGALSRGDIRVIGATTDNEVSHIMNDKALARRFSIVNIKEFNKAAMKQLLGAIAQTYTNYHKVNISADVMNATLDYCDMVFDKDRVFPDKLIDVIDETMARINFEQMTVKDKEVTLADIQRTIKLQTGKVVIGE